MHEKAEFVCFIYMQPQKEKFKYVEINMKHVSYTDILLAENDSFVLIHPFDFLKTLGQ